MLLCKAEESMRDWSLTGVQTCAFFLSSRRRHTRLVSDWSSDVCSSDLSVTLSSANDLSPIQAQRTWDRQAEDNVTDHLQRIGLIAPKGEVDKILETVINRSEERRVGKECRSRWSPYH